MDNTVPGKHACEGLNRRAEEVVAARPRATYDYGLKAAWLSGRPGFWQVRQVGKGGNSHPFEQYARPGRRLDAPALRWRDGNTDGDLLDEGDDTLYFTSDANMNVTAAVDASAAVQERYTYEAYGRSRKSPRARLSCRASMRDLLAFAPLATGLLSALLSAAGIPAASSQAAATQASAADWVRRLGDDQWKVREEAQRQLIALGEEARPAVMGALISPDMEVRIRARAIWARLPVLTRFTCSGQVKDAAGSPAAGAELVAYYWKDDLVKGSTLELIGRCRADTSGEFAFDVPLEAGWPMGFVAARAPGWATAWTDWGAKNDCTLALTLQKPLPLGGTVEDDKGVPVGGASVRAQLLLPTADGVRILDSLPQCDWFAATTDPRGRFQFDNVPPHTRAALLVRAPGHGCLNEREQVWGWLAQRPARAGKTDLRIVLPPEAAIAGKVVERDTGKVLPGLMVNTVNGERTRPAALSAADGTFRLGSLTTGEHTLALVAPADATNDWTADFLEVELEPDRRIKHVVLEAVKGGLLEATLVDAGDRRPVAGGTLSVCAANDQTPFMTRRFRAVRSTREGLAVIRLPPGNYRIISAHKDGEYLRHLPLMDDRFTITAGERVPLELSLPPMKRITGKVFDAAGQPVAGAWLTGIPNAGAGMSDAQGRFDFTSDITPSGGGPRQLLARHAQRNLCALLDVNPDADTEVRLAPGVRITGRVTDPEGRPLAGVFVRAGVVLEEGYAGAGRRDMLTDADGRYEWRGLPAGRIRLHAAARSGQGQVEVQAESGAQEPVRAPDIILTKTDP